MDLLRTPEDRFAGLDWPEPSYVTVSDGIRVAVVDLGPRDAPVVLCLHGEPTWSYLYRKVAPVLVDAGCRVVAPDLVGFGRSDKPADVTAHSYAAHVRWMSEALLSAMDLRDVTLLAQDWGGLIGLRLVAEAPERFAAVVVSNTGLPIGGQRMSDEWLQFRDFVAACDVVPVGDLVRMGCRHGLSDADRAAYEAPFPDGTWQAGPRAMPALVPTDVDDPGAVANREAWKVLERFDRPFVTAFTDHDRITAGGFRPFQERVPGAAGAPHVTIEGGGHFVQEDCPAELAAAVLSVVPGR